MYSLTQPELPPARLWYQLTFFLLYFFVQSILLCPWQLSSAIFWAAAAAFCLSAAVSLHLSALSSKSQSNLESLHCPTHPSHHGYMQLLSAEVFPKLVCNFFSLHPALLLPLRLFSLPPPVLLEVHVHSQTIYSILPWSMPIFLPDEDADVWSNHRPGKVLPAAVSLQGNQPAHQGNHYRPVCKPYSPY